MSLIHYIVEATGQQESISSIYLIKLESVVAADHVIIDYGYVRIDDFGITKVVCTVQYVQGMISRVSVEGHIQQWSVATTEQIGAPGGAVG